MVLQQTGLKGGHPLTDHLHVLPVACGLTTEDPIGSSAVVPEVTGWPLALLRREHTGASGVLTFPDTGSTS